MSLKRYIIRINRVSKAAGSTAEPFNIDTLSPEDMQHLADRLAEDLAPAALDADGKLRGYTLVEKRSVLNMAVSELIRLGQHVEVY